MKEDKRGTERAKPVVPWQYALLSMGIFVAAVFASAIPTIGMILAVSLVMVGGFLMLIPRIHRDREEAVDENPSASSEEIFSF